MIRITVDAALKRSLDSEGRRDPLLQEIFHEGDSIAQCPACKSWMLAQSWDALGGSCACSYKPGSTERVQIRRTEATPATPGATPATPDAPTTPQTPTATANPPNRLGAPGWLIWLVALFVGAGIPLIGSWVSSPDTPPQTDPRPITQPVPLPQPQPEPTPGPAPLEINSQTFEKWTVTVSKRRGSSESPSCELTTSSIATDGGPARSDRSILVAVKAGYGTVSVKGPYRTGGEVLLQVHGAAYRLTDFESIPHAAASDIMPIIEAFKAGLEARSSGMTIIGGPTSDLYSLLGFTASFTKALESCSK